MNPIEIQKLRQRLHDEGEGTLITSKYPGGKCWACRGKVERGDWIVYDSAGKRGRKVRHPECVGAPPDVIAARAAAVAAEEAAQRLAEEAERQDFADARGARLEAEKAGLRVLHRLVTENTKVRRQVLAWITAIERDHDVKAWHEATRAEVEATRQLIERRRKDAKAILSALDGVSDDDAEKRPHLRVVGGDE